MYGYCILSYFVLQPLNFGILTEMFKELFIFLAAPEHYGLFLADDDSKKGLWLESGRSLEYYLLRTGVRHLSIGHHPKIWRQEAIIIEFLSVLISDFAEQLAV